MVAVWGPTGLVYQRSEDDEDRAGQGETESRRPSTGGGFDNFFKPARSRRQRSIDLEAVNRSLEKA